jgi:hypothetical protein
MTYRDEALVSRGKLLHWDIRHGVESMKRTDDPGLFQHLTLRRLGGRFAVLTPTGDPLPPAGVGAAKDALSGALGHLLERDHEDLKW